MCAGLHKGNSPVTPSSGVCWQRLKSWIWTFVLYENSLQGKKVVPCRFDWHQTGTQVIISIYAKNAVPELSYVDANSTTVSLSDRSSSYQNILSLDFFPSYYLMLIFAFLLQLDIHIIFDGEKEFEQKISLWGVSLIYYYVISLHYISFSLNSFIFFNCDVIETNKKNSKFTFFLINFFSFAPCLLTESFVLQVIDVSKSLVNMMAAKIEVAMKKSEAMSWARLDLPPPPAPPKESEKQKSDSEDEDEDEDDW